MDGNRILLLVVLGLAFAGAFVRRIIPQSDEDTLTVITPTPVSGPYGVVRVREEKTHEKIRLTVEIGGDSRMTDMPTPSSRSTT